MASTKLIDEIKKIAGVDLFKRDERSVPATGTFVGRPFYLDYAVARLLVADAWKHRAGGLPQGCFLLAYYDGEPDVKEAILLRVLRPASLPTDSDVVSSMVEYYKDNLKMTGKESQLDSFTRYEFSFSGLECRTLGTFVIPEKDAKIEFGADVETFYSPHNYSVVKPSSEVLEMIVNFREGDLSGGPSDIRFGRVRYSSTRRAAAKEPEVPVYVSPRDFLGTRTALFGMTRTGKSNSVKKIIQATVAMSDRAPATLGDPPKKSSSSADLLDPFTSDRAPKFRVGQIIFDINGEYANPNLQDAGTAIYELFADRTERYSVIPKPDFKVMKVNFYQDVESGFELIKSLLGNEPGDYVKSFLSIDFSKPEDYATNPSAKTRYDRRVAAYQCCLKRAGFALPKGFKIDFDGAKDLNELTGIDPKKKLSPDDAISWWTAVWDAYDTLPYLTGYKKKHGHEWADEDLKAILAMLTRKKAPAAAPTVSGFTKLRAIADLHTDTIGEPFEKDISSHLSTGGIVIVDLSQGDPEVQRLYSERICRHIFSSSMQRFIGGKPNNFVQFYFEEAHNLFPKRDDKDLSQIYNRLAKEGAKLQLGLIYATQEVSSISSNILKNTQNWFIAHLNNDDETKELRKYYDFADFADSLIRFSASSDRGFARVKTYSNPFIVPIQVDRFASK